MFRVQVHLGCWFHRVSCLLRHATTVEGGRIRLSSNHYESLQHPNEWKLNAATSNESRKSVAEVVQHWCGNL